MSHNTLPTVSGSYALWLALPAPLRLVAGRLGLFDLPAGDYLYLGSARGPGGLRARLGRHLDGSGRPHWHVDALRSWTVPRGGWYTAAPGPVECAWSQAALELPGASAPVLGFGASDCHCGCPAHLVAFTAGLDPQRLVERLQAALPDVIAVVPFSANE